MKIIHILHEFPFPPNSGIRCDMSRRLAAFHDLGHEVFVICWISDRSNDQTTESSFDALQSVCKQYHILRIGSDAISIARRLWNMKRYPSYIASRIPSGCEQEQLVSKITQFGPDLIWVEGVHAAWMAEDLRRRFPIPLAYRAHNVEYKYVAEQAQLARSKRLRLALKAGSWGLEQAERHLHASSDYVFDISADDLNYWRSEGFRNNHWLATQPDPEILTENNEGSFLEDIDLLFIGSLSSPNNIEGIVWFLSDVFPKVKMMLPDIRLVFAGRNPSDELRAVIIDAGAELISNPPNAAKLFQQARVLFNPILHGSGVNIKTVDMLATGKAVVTTGKGARGLPSSIVNELLVADSALEFAKLCVEKAQQARSGSGRVDRTELIEKTFGRGAVAAAIHLCKGF